MVYGWLIVGVFTLFVGAAMAEICSAFPTSGGLYYWSSQLAGQRWGPFASWMTGWYAQCPRIIYAISFPSQLPMSSKLLLLITVVKFVILLAFSGTMLSGSGQ